MSHTLTLYAPLLSLRELAGVGGEPLARAHLARARGVAAPSARDAEMAGGGISVDSLRAYVESIGGMLEIRVTLPGR